MYKVDKDNYRRAPTVHQDERKLKKQKKGRGRTIQQKFIEVCVRKRYSKIEQYDINDKNNPCHIFMKSTVFSY